MAIIFAGTSLADFQHVGPVVAVTANRAPNVNEAFDISGASYWSNANLPIKLTDFWVTFYSYHSSVADLRQFVQFYDVAYSDINPLFAVHVSSTHPRPVGIRYYNGTAHADQAPLTGASSVGALMRYDVHIKIADVGGECEIYINNERQYYFSGDTNYIAGGGIDRVQFRQANTGGGSTHYSAVIVADEDTRGMEFLQSKPTGNGGAVGWAGAYTDVDEVGFSDTDFITAETFGATETYTKPALPAGYASGYNVAAVVLGARAQAVSAKLVGAFRIGGTNYEGASLKATVGLTNGKQSVNALNPATGLPWTFAEVNALEFGVKLLAP